MPLVGAGLDDDGGFKADKEVASSEYLIVPLRMEVYDKTDWSHSAAWAAGGCSALWKEPLLHWVGPCCLCCCDGWLI